MSQTDENSKMTSTQSQISKERDKEGDDSKESSSNLSKTKEKDVKEKDKDKDKEKDKDKDKDKDKEGKGDHKEKHGKKTKSPDHKHSDKQEDALVKPKGKFSKLCFRAASRLGLHEETKLDSVFVANLEKVEVYRQALDQLLTGCEQILQPNERVVETGAVVDPPDCNPWEKLGASLEKLKAFEKEPAHNQVEKLEKMCNKVADSEREGQKKARKRLQRIRQFVIVELKKMEEDQEKLDQFLIMMDQERQKVKNSKTKDDLEDAGKAYKRAVRGFNELAEEMDKVVDSMSTTVFYHQKELVKFFSERELFHREVHKFIKDTIKL